VKCGTFTNDTTYTLSINLQLNITLVLQCYFQFCKTVSHLSAAINDNTIINIHIKMSCSLGDNIRVTYTRHNTSIIMFWAQSMKMQSC
jgi:hypothetical protein